MSTRQMLATAVLKNSGGLYSALSGLPSRKGSASHLQKNRVLSPTQWSAFWLVFPSSVWSMIKIPFQSTLTNKARPIMFNPQSASIIYTFIHCQTPICVKKSFYLWEKKYQRSFQANGKNIFEDLMTPPCHSWWALEGQIQLLLIQSAKLSAKTFRATLSKHTHHFRGGHSVDEAGPPPFQLSSPSLAFEGRDCLDLGHVHYFGPRHRRQSAAVAADAFLLQTYREVVLVMGIRRAFS